MSRRIKIKQERVITTDKTRAQMAVDFSREVELSEVRPTTQIHPPLMNDRARTVAMDLARGADMSTVAITGVNGIVDVVLDIGSNGVVTRRDSSSEAILRIERVRSYIERDVRTLSMLISFAVDYWHAGVRDTRVLTVALPDSMTSTPERFMDEVQHCIRPLLSDLVTSLLLPNFMSALAEQARELNSRGISAIR